MSTTILRINAEIYQLLASNVLTNPTTLNFLLKSQEAVLLLAFWINSIEQEPSSAGQSSLKEAWLLDYSCVRDIHQQLEKVRVPAVEFSDDSANLGGVYKPSCFSRVLDYSLVVQENYFKL